MATIEPMMCDKQEAYRWVQCAKHWQHELRAFTRSCENDTRELCKERWRGRLCLLLRHIRDSMMKEVLTFRYDIQGREICKTADWENVDVLLEAKRKQLGIHRKQMEVLQ